VRSAFACVAVVVAMLAAAPVAVAPVSFPIPEPRPLETGTAPLPLAVHLAGPHAVRDGFRKPPRAGLLFDVDTGRVLWRRQATRRLPIASLTKMMTALVAVRRIPAGGRVRITRAALRYEGSGVGLLPKGRSIGISTMLHGLLLASGNDAAIAIAQRASGSLPAFVADMNARVAEIGLPCTRFVSPHGLEDGNMSCAADLAALGRAVLREPRLAPIVARRRAVLPFPIKGGKLWLYNHNPLLRMRYRGTTGIKTGYTVAAGRCLVATVRRGGVHLGVVLLHSPDPARQARLPHLGVERLGFQPADDRQGLAHLLEVDRAAGADRDVRLEALALPGRERPLQVLGDELDEFVAVDRCHA
jgi:D-alanyl-D-alanine carboxypeptidase (penicillin-binding protein 5/6)